MHKHTQKDVLLFTSAPEWTVPSLATTQTAQNYINNEKLHRQT